MHTYKVVASTVKCRIVAVVDAHGRCHVGRALATVPAPDAELYGDAPAAGIRRLYTTGPNVPCPLVLLLIDCERDIAARMTAIPEQEPKPARYGHLP